MKTIRSNELEIFNKAVQKGYRYDPQTGDVYNSKGQTLRRIDPRGYYRFGAYIESTQFNIYSHRFAWFYIYGKLPDGVIDHIDGNIKNNKIKNLRDVSQSINSLNTTRKDVCFHKYVKKWCARISHNRVRKHLGYFDTEEAALKAFDEAKKRIFEDLYASGGLGSIGEGIAPGVTN